MMEQIAGKDEVERLIFKFQVCCISLLESDLAICRSGDRSGQLDQVGILVHPDQLNTVVELPGQLAGAFSHAAADIQTSR